MQELQRLDNEEIGGGLGEEEEEEEEEFLSDEWNSDEENINEGNEKPSKSEINKRVAVISDDDEELLQFDNMNSFPKLDEDTKGQSTIGLY